MGRGGAYAYLSTLQPIPMMSFLSGAIDSLVRWYCREAGVRNLEKHIEKASGIVWVGGGDGVETKPKGEPMID